MENNQVNWKSELEEMSSSTSDNVKFHYEFVKLIGETVNKDYFNIEQVILVHDILANINEEDDQANHMVYMTVNNNADSLELAFPFDNTSPQRFSVNIIKVNSVVIENFMGINVYKEIFNDTNMYFDLLLIGIINSVIQTINNNEIY